jgi:hypothetical protein
MDLKYFVGKVCTILTSPINRDFKQENPSTYPEQLYNYFMGRVLEVDGRGGIWLEQVLTPEKLKCYFYGQHIIGVAEERVLDPNVPENAEIIEKIKSANVAATKQAEAITESLPKSTSPFVDVGSLTEISQKLAETYK